MRNIARLLAAALLSLTAGPAIAQNVPANSVMGRLAIPAGGGTAQAIPFSAFGPVIGANIGWLRVNTIQNPTTGLGMELGYDGVEGIIQSFSSRATLALSPIFYTAALHKFTGGFLIQPGSLTLAGSRVFSISSTENGAVSGAPGPIQLTWGSSAVAPWDASPSGGNIGGNANVVTTTMYAKQDTFDVVPWQTTAHLSAGTSSAIVGTRVQAYIDSTATTPRGGTGLEVLMRNANTIGDIWGTNIGAVYAGTTTTGALHGTEYDLEASGATIKYKFGVVIGSTQSDTATVTGTLAVNGTSDTIPGSAAYWVTGFGGGGATGFNTGLLTIKEIGGATPITGRLWYAGGFTIPTGLDWGRMTFSSRAMLLPNNAPIQAYATDNTTIYTLISLNNANQINIGGGLTVDPTTGVLSNARRQLTGNATYFVRTDGSDSNTGLVNSAGGAFLTLQKAANVILNAVNLNGFSVTVSVGAGTYTGGVSITAPLVGQGVLTFQGDTVTPSNVVISTTSASAFSITNGAAVTITGFKLQTTTSGNCISADMGAQVTTGLIQYGASAGDHAVASHGAMIYVNGNEQIRGGASAHWHAGNGGQIQPGGINIDAAGGAYAFSSEFAGVSENGTIFVLTGTNFTNVASITGQRYLAHTGGYITTQAVSTSDTYLPGNVTGTAFDGGFYNSTQFTTGMDVPAIIRSTGITGPSTGIGLEIGYDGTEGIVQAVDHGGGVFKPIFYQAATSHTFKLAGTTVATITASNISAPNGINFGGSTLSNYVSTTSWTPADGSGAALSFSGVSANYTRVGNMVFAYGRVTYPVTANASAAVISGLPITSANATYATTPCTFYSTGGSTNALSATVAVNATTFSMTKGSGATTLNSDVSGATLVFHCIYPAT